MGYFKLPFLIKKFWWGQCGDRRKSHWFKWDEMTKSKMVSGMVLDIYSFLMILCWPNNLGGFCIIGTLCFIESLRQDFSQMAQ